MKLIEKVKDKNSLPLFALLSKKQDFIKIDLSKDKLATIDTYNTKSFEPQLFYKYISNPIFLIDEEDT